MIKTIPGYLKIKEDRLLSILNNPKIRQFNKYGLGEELKQVRAKIKYLESPWYKKIFIKNPF